MQRMRSFLRELSMLISWSLEDSIEVSVSMESRGIPNRIENVVSFVFVSPGGSGLVYLFCGYVCRCIYLPGFEEILRHIISRRSGRRHCPAWSVAALVTAAAGMLAPVAYDSYFLMSVRNMGQMGDGEKGDA